MIKPLYTSQLSAAKPRSGLNRVSELIPRLIRHYELQAELMKQREEQYSEKVVVIETSRNEVQQTTFGWD